MKKTLPVSYPPITSYPSIATILSILWPQTEMFLPWFCDRFIQLVSCDDEDIDATGFFYDEKMVKCPLLEYQLINGFDMFNAPQALTDFIEFNIEKGYYVSAPLDWFYISESPYYHERHLEHGLLIYGFDAEKKTVMLSDFFQDGKLVQTTASYSEVNKGYSALFSEIPDTEPRDITWMMLLKISENRYNFNKELFTRYLQDYINGIDSFGIKYQEPRYNTNHHHYGLEYYDVLATKIHSPLNIRPYHILYDHKLAWRIRIKFLIDNKFLPLQFADAAILRCENLISETLRMRNLAIKYKTTSRAKEKERLITLIERMKQMDLEFCRFIQSAMQQKVAAISLCKP